MENNQQQGISLTHAYTKREVRQNQILFLLLKNKTMTNKELQEAMGCSEATIRNDLRELDELKLIHRYYGGAMALDDTYGNIPMDEHLEHATKEKESIARYVVNNLIRPGMSIVIDTGSTCLALSRLLSKVDFPLNVVTNSLLNAEVFAKNYKINLTVPGGIYNAGVDSFDCSLSSSFYERIHPEVFFFSANGINSQIVTITRTSDSIRSVIKKSIIQSAEKSILLVDHTKIDKTCFYEVCNTKQIDLVVTDDLCTEKERESFINLGVPVEFSPTLG